MNGSPGFRSADLSHIKRWPGMPSQPVSLAGHRVRPARWCPFISSLDDVIRLGVFYRLRATDLLCINSEGLFIFIFNFIMASTTRSTPSYFKHFSSAAPSQHFNCIAADSKMPLSRFLVPWGCLISVPTDIFTTCSRQRVTMLTTHGVITLGRVAQHWYSDTHKR